MLLWTTICIQWACSHRPNVDSSETVLQKEATAASAFSQHPPVLPQYRLGFGDVIEIQFFRNPEFNETVTVRPDGRISLAKIEEIEVTGMTPSQLDSLITGAYADFLLDPDVTVIVRKFGGYQVFVLGEVTSPGGFPIQKNMTILQAIALAGGPKISAKLENVMVLRRGQTDEVEAIKLNLSKPVIAKSKSDIKHHDILVQPQDIIFIPKTFIANVSDFMKQIYAGFLPPLDLYLRAILFYDR